MKESSVYEHFLQKAEAECQRAFQQGARQYAIKNLFVVLEFRFDVGAVQALRPTIENIEDLQRLQDLYGEALRAETFEAFARTLRMNGDE